MSKDTEQMSAVDADGLREAGVLTDAIRTHQAQVSKLVKRRKSIVIRLYRQGFTYREMASAMRVSQQLVYKIIVDDIDRTVKKDAEGKVIRKRGRPAKKKSKKKVAKKKTI